MNLLETAVEAARAGGAKLIEGLDRPKEVVQKSERSNIVTWADEASQAAVFEVLSRRHPDHELMGEEGSGGTVGGPYTWIVDPLDGTSNYARGLSPWGVSVAVRETNGPLMAGVIYNPLTEEIYTTAAGVATGLGCGDTTSIDKAVIATGLQNDDPAVIREHVLRMEQLYLHCRGVRAIGCPAFAMAWIAAGKIDGFVEKGATYAWDIAAATLLIEQSGGMVTDFDGNPPNLGRGLANVVASNAAIHADLLEIVNMRRA